MKLRALTAGLALLATGTIIGLGTQQLVSADVSSGDRPVFVPIESCRLADTRPDFNVGPRTAPLGPTETYRLDTQQAGTECTGDIPTSASSIAVNVTAPDSTGESFVTLWADGNRPNGSTLNPQAGQLVFNAATVDLAADNSFRVYNNANDVHIIIDVIGYYENHNHDDRYYTETEVDSKVAAAIDAQPWSMVLGPADLLNPLSSTGTDYWPAPTFGSGVRANGIAFDDGVFGRVWFSIGLPDNYVAGSDIAIDMRYIPISGLGAPVLPCESVWWSNAPTVNRPGEQGFNLTTTWSQPRGFDDTRTRVESTQAMFDDSTAGESTMTIDGDRLRPLDSLVLTLNRDGDESDDTCEGMMITGLLVRPA